jgi:hypothetical protein
MYVMYFLMYDGNDGVDLSPFSCPAIFFYDKNPSLAAGRLLFMLFEGISN